MQNQRFENPSNYFFGSKGCESTPFPKFNELDSDSIHDGILYQHFIKDNRIHLSAFVSLCNPLYVLGMAML
jgi:hypothetical protein